MSEEYELNIDLNVLNHLGLNLYSNVPAVLSEVIANAWDADASRVDISIDGQDENKKVTIKDDGCGMNGEDLRNKFLMVGYQRRSKELANSNITSGKKRTVMGRKGIGKLSVFSIAENIKIITKQKDCKPIAIELEIAGIKQAIENKKNYHPRIIAIPSDIDLSIAGTALILGRLKKRVNASLDAHLRQRVARRFSVFSDTFRVFIDGKEITLTDRNYFKKLEYALIYGDYPKGNFTPHNIATRWRDLGDYPKGNFTHNEDNVVERDYDSCIPIRGWIGLVKESGALQEGGDNLNKISVLVRGKVALEDILDSFREGGLYTKYIIGEIEADFLDSTEEEDIATSSRQDFIQSDPRFIRLKEFVENELKFLQGERAKLKDKEGERQAQEIPAVKNWYQSLKGDTKVSAKKLFGKINQIAVDHKHRKTLYKHGILAFEHLRHKEKLNEMEQLDINNLEATVNLFSELDDIEASWYYQITEGRLDVIKKLSDDVDQNVLEKIIQEHIYTHLWLLDPSWDRATETPSLEKSVTTSFEKISDKLSAEEKRGRIDIRYKKSSGKHVIIELKRASVKTRTGELMDQVDKYVNAVQKQIDEANDSGAIEVICLVGRELNDWDTPKRRQESEQSLEAKNIRVITYQQLIKDAEKSYQAYLEKSNDKGRIKKILDEIEAFNDDVPDSNG